MTVTKFLDKKRLAFIAMSLGLLFLLTLNDPEYFWHLKTGEYLVPDQWHSVLWRNDPKHQTLLTRLCK